MSIRPLQVFTVHPDHYPLYTKGFCSISTREAKTQTNAGVQYHKFLIYTFDVQQAALIFFRNLNQWMTTKIIDNFPLNFTTVKPLRADTGPFTDQIEVEFYEVWIYVTDSNVGRLDYSQ